MASLSSRGLKAHAGHFPFMYKGPLISSDERRQQQGKEVTAALAPSAGQGGRPQAILPAGGPALLGTGATHLQAPGAPHGRGTCLCTPPRGGPAPRTSAAAGLTRHVPWAEDWTSGLSPDWKVLKSDPGLCSLRELSPATSACGREPAGPLTLLSAVPFSQDQPSCPTQGRLPRNEAVTQWPVKCCARWRRPHASESELRAWGARSRLSVCPTLPSPVPAHIPSSRASQSLSQIASHPVCIAHRVGNSWTGHSGWPRPHPAPDG